MLVKTLDETVIRQIGHAFGYYDYGIETGLVSLFSSRDDVATYISGYVRAVLQSGMLYTVGDGKEAFIAYKRPGEKVSLRAVWPLLKAVFQSMNFSQMLRFVWQMQKAGPGTEDKFKKAKKHCIFVGMVCVLEPYQGQGYMRRLLELAFAEGDRLGIPVILETDAISKCDKYVHLGMELVLTRNLGEYGKIYDLVRYPAGRSATRSARTQGQFEGDIHSKSSYQQSTEVHLIRAFALFPWIRAAGCISSIHP